MDWRVIGYYLGRIAAACGAVLVVPLAAALALGEAVAASFLMSMLCCAFVGWLGWKLGRVDEGQLTVREGIAVTGLAWLMTGFFGMLPYSIGQELSLTDGIFESVSGFTGFGGTVIARPEALPRSLLLWRSLTQWLGGLGIIVFFIALLPQTGQSAVYMYQAESAGPVEERVRPRLKEMTAILFWMYFAFTALAGAVYAACGMSSFDAANHALTTIATGGFSTYSDSAAHFRSAAVEAAMTFFIVLAGGSFAMYYRVYVRGWRALRENTELKAYLLILACGTAALTISLWSAGLYGPLDALRYASFQAASISTTGFVSADFDVWPPFAKCLMLVLMTVGGCAGSTAAGLKVTRAVLLARMLAAHLWERLHPRMVAPVRMNGAAVPQGVLLRVGLFFFVYLFFILLVAFLVLLDGTPLFDAAAMSVTTISTVGPGFGIVGATETYAGLSAFTKSVLCCAMLLGRLEFFTLLVMLRPSFWRSGRGW